MALALDETAWDLDLPIRKATAAEQIRQTIRVRMMTRRGEWQFDTDQGLPFVGTIFTKNPDHTLIESIIRTECALVTGVVGVQRVSIDLDRATRIMTVEADVLTDEGLLTVTL